MSRFVILAIGSFDYIENKTGNMLIRYKPDQVLAVIDPYKEGKTALKKRSLKSVYSPSILEIYSD